MNALQEYDGSEREATIPWLDQAKQVAERTGIDPLEVGTSTSKGLALANISTVHKEEVLSWHKFRQYLIKQYSNVPYVPNTMFTYSNIIQWDDESITGYLVRAKVLFGEYSWDFKIVRNLRVWNGQPVAYLWPLGTPPKVLGHKGTRIFVHDRRCF